ncbi:hypothetical protein Rsub_11642 [Raphidocelis subcapitata]|uniref:CS domain-containing protein n=1 Tax=Raphidocelis subcapitata TaxID=307507 RepID=A0A2V0PFM0_9CHLO|nr:hypothetical protein Rsub_11642 [Raphidocelis subcapitata]|eukprot:GBF98648.1 hypothetical protein Rsub_11642 [Raphidocelis subcapitata]
MAGHFAAGGEAELRALRLGHLKRRGADALASGDARAAIQHFTAALQLCGGSSSGGGGGGEGPDACSLRRALLANRSAAALAAGRAAAALSDADLAAAAAPLWPKAHWRRGRALAALGRWPEAAAAYARAHGLAAAAGDAAAARECAAALSGAVGRLTRQQVADATLELALGAGGVAGGAEAARPGGCLTASAAEGPGEHHVQLLTAAGVDGSVAPAAAPLAQPPAEPPAGGAASPLALVPAAAPAGAEAAAAAAAAAPPEVACAAAACANGGTLEVVEDSEGRRVGGESAWLRREVAREAAFLEVREEGRAESQSRLARWLLRPNGAPPPGEAALLRARLAARLRSWGAARREAEAAVAALSGAAGEANRLCRQLVSAHETLGDACMLGDYENAGGAGPAAAAVAGGGDPAAAAAAYRIALDLLPPPPPPAAPPRGGGAPLAAWAAAARRRIAPRLAAARSRLSDHQQLQGALNYRLTADAHSSPATGGASRAPAGGDGTPPRGAIVAAAPAARVVLRFAWPAAPSAGGEPRACPAAPGPLLSAGDRAALLAGLAAAAAVPRTAVLLEGISTAAPAPREPKDEDRAPAARIDVALTMEGEGAARAFVLGAGASLLAFAAAAAQAGQPAAARLLREWGGKQGCSLSTAVVLAHPQQQHLQPAVAAPQPPFAAAAPTELPCDLGAAAAASASAVAPPAPPARLPLALPYARYRLVSASGAPVERPDKHPFCMSRVHYAAAAAAASSAPSDPVWFEPADGSCRWRQSASEVEVQCLRVPPGLPASALSVQIAPFSLRVANAASGEVYLDGRLHRGVAPRGSGWAHGGGEGEEGCVVTLAKMNLELFERRAPLCFGLASCPHFVFPWRHSECWWPRLFEGDGHAAQAVAWDDADKDYSDLPPAIEALRLREAAREDGARREAAADKALRARLQGLEDRRRAERQERLAALRRRCWEEAAPGAAPGAAQQAAAARAAAAGGQLA